MRLKAPDTRKERSEKQQNKPFNRSIHWGLACPLYLTLGPRGSSRASFPAAQLAIVNADPRSTIAGIPDGLVEEQKQGKGMMECGDSKPGSETS